MNSSAAAGEAERQERQTTRRKSTRCTVQMSSPTSPSLDGLGDATLTRRRTGPKVPVDSGQGREDGLGVCTDGRTRTDISDTRHVEGSRKSNEGTFDRWLVTGESKGKASQPNCARKTRRTSAACASCPSLSFLLKQPNPSQQLEKNPCYNPIILPRVF